MNRPPPPLNLIRSFECTARHLSFTRAAQELGYTQAAISTHVRSLEKYIGRDLFVRNARSLQLTEIGAAFLPTLRQALNQIDAATEAILAGRRELSVIVACPFSLAENWLAKAIAAYRRARPEIEVTIHGTVWEEAEDRIADLVITVNRNDEIPPGAQPLWAETLSLVCAPALAKSLEAPADVSAHRRIIIAGRQEYWSILADSAAEPALAAVDSGHGAMYRTNASNVALELAAQGAGVTIALTSLCRTYLERGLLTEPFAIRPASPWTYYIVNRNQSRGMAAERLLRYLLASVAGQMD
jgi:LysR family transcriptional regulator, glycine cleavage system transcriptional activator